MKTVSPLSAVFLRLSIVAALNLTVQCAHVLVVITTKKLHPVQGNLDLRVGLRNHTSSQQRLFELISMLN